MLKLVHLNANVAVSHLTRVATTIRLRHRRLRNPKGGCLLRRKEKEKRWGNNSRKEGRGPRRNPVDDFAMQPANDVIG
jgi:hypothetical protein